MQPPPRARAARRRKTATVLFGVSLAAAIEITSAGALGFLGRRGVPYRPLAVDRLSDTHRASLEALLAGRPSLFRLDARLGWSLQPGFHSDTSTIDPDGLRRDPARPAERADAVAVSLFGDSFTFGGDVEDRFAYPEVLARLDPALAISNFGVPAYGLDQTFLRYQRDGRGGRGGVVVIGFMSENIFRSLSVFRPFYQPATLLPLAKPRFELAGGELALLANPLPHPDDYRRLLARPAEVLASLGKHDAYYRTKSHASPLDRSATVRLAKLALQRLAPDRQGVLRGGIYDVDGEAFRLVVALFQAFDERVRADGARPVIVIYPQNGDLTTWRTARIKSYAPLIEALRAKGLRVVDAMDALDRAAARPVAELIPVHFTPLANRLVAEHLLQRLRELALIP